ncbi:MAG: DUF1071 domain-containing protein [Pseudomonadales bacterium]|nr:DUF1071 domain-containing protein [Pseudomonadales bacterium]
MKDIFKDLSSININDKVEKKGQHKYLSWAHAWTLAKQKFPEIQRVVYECESTGLNYFTDGNSAYVKVGITIKGLEHIDYLPVMDFRNNALPLDKVTSMEVNKTIQRSTTKAIAMHGLGLSLWSGEDIVQTTNEVTPKKEEKVELIINTDNWAKVLKYIASNKELGLPKIIKNLETKYNLKATIKKELSKHV